MKPLAENGSPRRCVRSLALLFLWPFVATGFVSPQEFQTFDRVDTATCLKPSRFADLWTRAEKDTVRIAVIGDSQETIPGGGGVVYIPRLNYEFFKRFKNAPETHWMPATSNQHGFLARTALPEKQAPSRIPPDTILPGLSPVGISSPNGTKNVTRSHYGLLCRLEPWGKGLHPGTQMKSETPYFKTDGKIVAEILAATHPESGSLAFRFIPTDAPAVTYFKPVLAKGAFETDLGGKGGDFRLVRTPPLPFSEKTPFLQVVVNAAQDDRTVDLVGIRFVNTSHPEGVVFQSFSVGGYRADSFLSVHGQSGRMLKALDFDAALLHYSANDGNHRTAEAYAANLKEIISRIRKAHDDPAFRIILCTDPDQNMGRENNRPHLDRHAGVHAALALSDPNILAVNSRRLMHDKGWIHGTEGMKKFTVDGVHYSPAGARLLAESEANILLEIGARKPSR